MWWNRIYICQIFLKDPQVGRTTNGAIYSTNIVYLSSYHGTDTLLNSRTKDMNKIMAIS